MRKLWSCALALTIGTGCAGAVIEPGHRGLMFNPRTGGLQHEVLAPGYYSLDSCFLRSVCSRIVDFDVSYSTKKEEIVTLSSEGLRVDIKVAVTYRPIIAELYELDTEVGPAYYDEVIGPEFRSIARSVFARHSYQELEKNNEKIEDEIEVGLRMRTKGKHVEIASVTMQQINYAPGSWCGSTPTEKDVPLNPPAQ
jgi:regulator of protease activity HflC (stomatin/prohibitin superfamily)